MNALKEQLLKAGFQIKPAEPKVEKPAAPHVAKRAHSDHTQRRPQNQAKAPRSQPPRSQTVTSRPDEISLAAAYHVRADQERRDKEAKQRQEAEVAARRKAARALIQELIRRDGISTEGAERCRHFRYGKKIKRMYLSDEQNASVNRAELGIVQLEGRFYLLPAAAVQEIQRVGVEFVAVFDPKEPSELSEKNADVDYSDPRFQVPDDLVW